MSDPGGIIEHVFDDEFRDADDATVVRAIGESQAAEAVAAARRLAAIAELTARRLAEDEHPQWACDGWDGAAAEVSAALGIGHGRASGQMDLGLALRERLPRVAALFWAGRVSLRVVSAIAWRTGLVTDEQALALIDAVLAEKAGGYEGLSQYKLEKAVDVWVDRHDPGALRRARTSVRNRDVTVGDQNSASGTTAVWGRLYATDAALLERRLAEMARAVCEDDPRTMGERRADALGALAAGSVHLRCQCGDPRCEAATPDGRAASITVHVLAEQAALDAAATEVRSAAASAPAAECRPPATDSPSAGMPTAVLLGGDAVPTPLLAELLKLGVRVRPVRTPGADAEPRYRPSPALTRFVRARDMTCRFPGCDKPAEVCDIDHGLPWPAGPTHPSNTRCLCRKHHLLRTFRGGSGGWRDSQHPDGTISWISPSGQTYTTRPGSHLLFPRWDTATAEISAAPEITASRAAQPAPGRGLMMPTRRRTRQQDRAARVRRDRALNDARVAERNRPPPF